MRIVGLLLCAVALCSAKVFAGDDGAFLPGDKVELILGTEDVSGIQVVKCGTMVLLKGKMKTANAKFLVWRLRQQFDNIVDLTTMTNDAYDDLIKIESGFSEELALSFMQLKWDAQDRLLTEIHKSVWGHLETERLEIERVPWGKKSVRTLKVEWYQHNGAAFGPYLDMRISLA